MPLIRYFGFVGTGLVLLLIGLGWCFPQPTAESPGSVSNGPTIRIASAEQLPERVVVRAGHPQGKDHETFPMRLWRTDLVGGSLGQS
jgi:hypothetical protein